MRVDNYSTLRFTFRVGELIFPEKIIYECSHKLSYLTSWVNDENRRIELNFGAL